MVLRRLIETTRAIGTLRCGRSVALEIQKFIALRYRSGTQLLYLRTGYRSDTQRLRP
jgi:hypothetical protein